jgi:hypothetical protein
MLAKSTDHKPWLGIAKLRMLKLLFGFRGFLRQSI